MDVLGTPDVPSKPNTRAEMMTESHRMSSPAPMNSSVAQRESSIARGAVPFVPSHGPRLGN